MRREFCLGTVMEELTGSMSSRVGFEEAESLVIRLKEGEESAFQEVFQLYKDLIFSLAFNMLADKSEAMDVTQEVFLTLYRKIHQFRGESSLKTWLYRVALNQAANRNRWWKRRRQNRTVSLQLNETDNGERGPDLISDRAQPDRQMLSAEVRKAIRVGLDQLPFQQRAVITLRDIHALSYEEISRVLGVHVGTVKSRIARGRERLRKLLKPYWQGKAL
ncbi:sigma-70 family RNA polymerase sigma factor [Acidobacteria bacterium AH-259-D05]|nr:sigma-70 family RNA polymerase sigma factor [Acidobacteria bacterium AH-259-D05]